MRFPRPRFTAQNVINLVFVGVLGLLLFQRWGPAPTPGPVAPIDLPGQAHVEVGGTLDLPATTHGGKVRWEVGRPAEGLKVFSPGDGHTGTLLATAPGVYHVHAWTAIKGEATEPACCVVTVGTPTPPVPPVPPIPPVPPAPPAPIPDAGLRVLVVFDGNNLPPEQRTMLTSAAVIDWLNGHCVKEPNGNAAWRIWPDKIDPTNDLPVWKTAFARPRASVPWIVVSNGKTGTEEPLPKTTAELLALLNKFGG